MPKHTTRSSQARPDAKHQTYHPRSAAASTANNQKAHWKTYQGLQKEIDKTWTQLQTAVKKKARPDTLLAYGNRLLLLLGECNYLAHEYMRLTTRTPKR